MATFRTTGEFGQKLIRNPSQRMGYAEKRASAVKPPSFRVGSALNKMMPKIGTTLSPTLGRVALPAAAYFTAKEAFNKWSKPKVLGAAESKIKLDRPFKDQMR